MSRLICVLWLCLLAVPAFAQTGVVPAGGEEAVEVATPSVPEALSSPRATMLTFMNAMGLAEPDIDTAVTCLTGVNRDAAELVCVKLFGAINRIEDVEGNALYMANYLEPAADSTTYIFFPRSRSGSASTLLRHEEIAEVAGSDHQIVIVKDEIGAWRFSEETTSGIDALYDAVESEPIVARDVRDEKELSTVLRFEDRLPGWARNKMIGLKQWQWAGLLALIFVGMTLDFFVRFWVRMVARRVIRAKGGEPNPETLRKMVRPFGLAVTALIWLWAFPYLGLPTMAVEILMPAVRLFVMLAVVWAAYRVTDLVSEVFADRAVRTHTKFDDLLIPLLRKTVKVFITVFGVIYVANSLDVPLAPLLTGLGIGGAGFAFAAKDTLEHFFGSVTVIADRPFQVGDWVTIGDVEGVVEEVGFRSTRVRTFYNSLVTVPNGNLVRAMVDNYGCRKYRRWRTHVNITYDTPPDRLEAFCEGIRELIRLHPYTRTDYYQVWLHEFGAHSLDVLVYMFFDAPDWQTELRERHRLMLDIMRLAQRLEVAFAFPTQTLHMVTEPGDADRPVQEPPSSSGVFESRALRVGRQAAAALTADARWRIRKPPPYHFVGAGEPVHDDDETQIESKIGGDA